MLYDVAIVGVGMAGLTCARQLQERGYQTIILEKSRGVGGRVTTRRVGDRHSIDRGLPWLEVQGEQTQKLIEQLQRERVIQPWSGRICQSDRRGKIQPSEPKHRYVAPAGINAIAKYLARDLRIEKLCRVVNLRLSADDTWQLIAEKDNFEAKAVVLAIPAPQAVELLSGIENILSSELIEQLRIVKYDSCITVSAGYDRQYSFDLPAWEVLNLNDEGEIARIISDGSKKNIAFQPIYIFHSTTAFASQYLESDDLQPIGERLLAKAALILQPWFNSSQWMQVHRWRYAIPSYHLNIACLPANSLPLVCCGDWCGGNNLESALVSGLAGAEAISGKVPKSR